MTDQPGDLGVAVWNRVIADLSGSSAELGHRRCPAAAGVPPSHPAARPPDGNHLALLAAPSEFGPRTPSSASRGGRSATRWPAPASPSTWPSSSTPPLPGRHRGARPARVRPAAVATAGDSARDTGSGRTVEVGGSTALDGGVTRPRKPHGRRGDTAPDDETLTQP
ncbi:hypothetical protein HBB16_07865 [Pseudonocardia sp. MCCB 268]|nr:hypothetical protein [Pseudonocardia cytotoxica]